MYISKIKDNKCHAVTCSLPSFTQSNEISNKKVCFKTRIDDLSFDMLTH